MHYATREEVDAAMNSRPYGWAEDFVEPKGAVSREDSPITRRPLKGKISLLVTLKKTLKNITHEIILNSMAKIEVTNITD